LYAERKVFIIAKTSHNRLTLNDFIISTKSYNYIYTKYDMT